MTGSWPEQFLPWFRCYHPRPGALLRLVCFPHAGGAASFYRRWGARLPPSAEALVVQYPGREDRILDECVADMDRLTGLIAGALQPVIDRPVALFGHSLGAIVAYEVARRLDSSPATRPARLIVSGRPAPGLSRGGTLHLGDDQALLAELGRLRATRPGVLDNPHLRELILPALRNDYRLSERYRPLPGPLLNCPVLACAGDRDSEATVPEMRAWQELTRGGFELHVFSGDHFYLVPREAEVVELVAGALGVPAGPPAAWPLTP